MSQLPSGTVTFLFTDIEGSTKLWQLYADAMPNALARHHTLLRAAIEQNNGYIFQIIGDAFCAAFATASDGLNAALAGQRALQGEMWGEIGAIRVRMALHTGAAQHRAGDYTSGEYVSGLTLSREARLLSAGHGGQILLSLPTFELVRDQLPRDVVLHDLGARRLKDLIRPERIFQVIAPGLRAEFPPLKTLDSLPNNLPIQLTSFVGREREMEDVKLLLAQTHLLTLVGAGGAGKTRLALQVGAELIDEFPDGVWFIDLASLTEAALIPQTVATILGLREEAGQSLLTLLRTFLQNKLLLLIFDNCEHLIEACARFVDQLLHAAPNLKILTTSRAVLHLRGEREYPIPPLALPDPHHLPAPDGLSQFAAVKLFIERAQAVKPNFQITNENAPFVAEICHRLDGLALAIELAAVRTKILPPQAILTRLEHQLRFLIGGARDLPARQQTLRNTIQWSYELLNANERALFRRLGVFLGGWSLQAAETVCLSSGSFELDALDGLTSLADKSLIRQQEDSQGEPRFVMLEMLREFALEQLNEQAESDVLRRAHAQHFVAFAENAAPFLESHTASHWLARLDLEYANLRAALRHLIEDKAAQDAARLVHALTQYWWIRGYLAEGREWFVEVLRLGENTNPALRAQLLDDAGFLARWQGDNASARTLIAESLNLRRALGNPHEVADSFSNLAYVLLHQGDRAQARDLYGEALSIYRELNHEQGIADTQAHLALIALQEGDFETAQKLNRESLEIWTRLGDQQGVSFAEYRLGLVYLRIGNQHQAESLFKSSLRVASGLHFKWGIAHALEGMTATAANGGNYESALRFAAAAAAVREASGFGLDLDDRVALAQILETAKVALGANRAELLWKEGHTADLEKIIADLNLR